MEKLFRATTALVLALLYASANATVVSYCGMRSPDGRQTVHIMPDLHLEDYREKLSVEQTQSFAQTSEKQFQAIRQGLAGRRTLLLLEEMSTDYYPDRLLSKLRRAQHLNIDKLRHQFYYICQFGGNVEKFFDDYTKQIDAILREFTSPQQPALRRKLESLKKNILWQKATHLPSKTSLKPLLWQPGSGISQGPELSALGLILATQKHKTSVLVCAGTIHCNNLEKMLGNAGYTTVKKINTHPALKLGINGYLTDSYIPMLNGSMALSQDTISSLLGNGSSKAKTNDTVGQTYRNIRFKYRNHHRASQNSTYYRRTNRRRIKRHQCFSNRNQCCPSCA